MGNLEKTLGFYKKKACQGNNQVKFIKTNDKHLMQNLLPSLLKMKIKLTIFFSYFQWIVCYSAKMCPSRNGNYLCRQIFLSQTTGWRLLHGNSAWDCHAFSLHRFQQNCPLERCLSKQAWNHPGSGIVSISFFSNLFRGQNILELIWNFPQIFYLQDNLNTMESLWCFKSTSI